MFESDEVSGLLLNLLKKNNDLKHLSMKQIQMSDASALSTLEVLSQVKCITEFNIFQNSSFFDEESNLDKLEHFMRQ